MNNGHQQFLVVYFVDILKCITIYYNDFMRYKNNQNN